MEKDEVIENFEAETQTNEERNQVMIWRIWRVLTG